MKMHEKKLKRFSTYKTVSNILFVLTILLGVLALIAVTVGHIYFLNNQAQIVDQVSEFLIAQDFPVRITEDFTIPNRLIYVFTAYIVLGISLVAYLFKSASRLFAFVVNSQTPFTPNVVKVLKSMGIAFFIYAGLKLIPNLLLSPSLGYAINFGFDTIDYKYLLFGVLLLALGEIFEFGMNLQEDSESIV